MRGHWKVWVPAYLLAVGAKVALTGLDSTREPPAATILFAAGWALVPFLIGFWALRALTSKEAMWPKAIGGLTAALAILAYSWIRP